RHHRARLATPIEPVEVSLRCHLFVELIGPNTLEVNGVDQDQYCRTHQRWRDKLTYLLASFVSNPLVDSVCCIGMPKVQTSNFSSIIVFDLLNKVRGRCSTNTYPDRIGDGQLNFRIDSILH